MIARINDMLDYIFADFGIKFWFFGMIIIGIIGLFMIINMI